jgi:hypothetical protein
MLHLVGVERALQEQEALLVQLPPVIC